jgi:nitrous oxide reductase accessory protein NosL
LLKEIKMIKQTAARMFFIGILLFLSGTASVAGDDINTHRSCAFCGMDRKAYGYSRMLIQYENGGSVGVCSLHCAVVELDANKGRAVKTLFVADRDSRMLIDAEKAVWVMGGKKPGVMTQRPKWAFASSTGAGAFIDAYGGKIVTWSEAFAAAREEVPREHR